MKHIKVFENADFFEANKSDIERPWIAVVRGDSFANYSIETPESSDLCFTALEDNSSVGMTLGGNQQINKELYYKVNNQNWELWDLSPITLNTGDKMYVKSSDSNALALSPAYRLYFVMSGKISASGNIMSLLNYTDTMPQYAFCGLFGQCASLTTAPELPATTLSPFCYYNMFMKCVSLTEAPELPAETLVQNCYNMMFAMCTALNYIKVGFKTTNVSMTSCLMNWVTQVSPTGTFVMPTDSAFNTTGINGIPAGWTVEKY